MQDLIKKLKNATLSQYDDLIIEYAKKEILKELKEAGISEDDLTQDDYDELLADKIKEAKSFTKGAMVAGGAFLFLELLG
jgi:hypothetical protein